MNTNTDEVAVITIDGPSGAGKGTLSQLVARHLKYHLLDSGALYRLVALSAHKLNINLQNEDAVADVASKIQVKFDADGDCTRILLAKEDVTQAIRDENVSMGASIVAAYPKVRAALLQRQRDFAQAPGLVADGRDMGTTVFPHAKVKIFLTASAEARAERRLKQLAQKGIDVDMAELIRDIKARDDRDTQREASPLKPAADALVLDSTLMTIDQVLNAILNSVR
ncbi:MAG: (d)CMP kinase [Gammaproteobacteria bacterium]|nr:MAG: (d)CMP kinase [Gammaproteobacteria bacterium]